MDTSGVEVVMVGWMLVACGLPRVPEVSAAVSGPADVRWDALVDEPGPITVETVVSARWAVPLSGVLDLTDPATAGLEDHDHPIVLPVTVLTHPDRGVFVIDTGVDSEVAAGRAGPTRGLLRYYLTSVKPEASLAAILHGRTVAGVLLTHAHLDHVLGLPDLPASTPIWTGEGELRETGLQAALMGGTFAAAFEGRSITTLDPDRAVPLGDLKGWDLLGDGSLWAIAAPGHTPGSTAYLARTPDGPVLAVGDTSHTFWGWEHGVAPGTFTEDHAANAESLRKLHAFADRHPAMKVLMGHEVEPTAP